MRWTHSLVFMYKCLIVKLHRDAGTWFAAGLLTAALKHQEAEVRFCSELVSALTAQFNDSLPVILIQIFCYTPR